MILDALFDAVEYKNDLHFLKPCTSLQLSDHAFTKTAPVPITKQCNRIQFNINTVDSQSICLND